MLSRILSNDRLILILSFVASFLIAFALLSRAAHGDTLPVAGDVAGSIQTGPAAAPNVPDPLDRPIEFWDQIEKLRETGGLYVVLLVSVLALSRAGVKRLETEPGAPPATGWRAKSKAVLLTVSVLIGGLLDLVLGSLTGVGFGVVSAGSAALLLDPRNKPVPPKESSSSRAGTLSVLLMATLLMASCTTARHAAGAGAAAGLDCQSTSIRATVTEAGVLARAYVLSTITGSGDVDTDALRSAARELKSDAMRCSLVAAIAAIAAAAEHPESGDAPQSMAMRPDPGRLRDVGRELAALEWGISGPILVDGGAL